MGKYDNKNRLENQVCFSLYVASREIIKLYKPCLDKFNLTYTQYLVIMVLWEDGRTSVKKIGERLHLDSGTLTPLLKKMEKSELIKRYRDVNDDRVVIIEPTDKCIDLKDKMTCIPCQMKEKLNIPDDCENNLREALRNLLDLL